MASYESRKQHGKTLNDALTYDILIQIFLLCVPDGVMFPPRRYQIDPLRAISQVCSTWRSAARSSNALWRQVNIKYLHGYPTEEEEVAFAKEWLSRITTSNLSLSVAGFNYHRDIFDQIIIPNSMRFGQLGLILTIQDFERLFTALLRSLTVLRITLVVLAPSSRTEGILLISQPQILQGTPHVYSGDLRINLANISTLELKMALNTDQLYQILDSCPKLEECTFFLYIYLRPEKTICCRALKRCAITIDKMVTGAPGIVLDALILPALEHLEFLYDARTNWTWVEIVSLIQRSKCDLRHLFLGPYTYNTSNEIGDILALTPNLTEFGPPTFTPPTRDLFRKIGTGEYVPQLKRVYIKPCMEGEVTESFLEVLEEQQRWALVSELPRPQISRRIEEVFLDWSPYHDFKETHLSRFRKLQSAGLRIHKYRRLSPYMELTITPVVL